jgi:colicin import membrane protein
MTLKTQAKRPEAASKSSKRSFCYSLFAHALVLTLLFWTSAPIEPIKQRPSTPTVIQNSTLINAAQLQQEIAAVKTEQLVRINQEKRQVQALQSEQASIQRALQAKQEALSNEQNRLAKLRQVQQQEAKQLAILQNKQAAAVKNFNDQQKQLTQTQQKLKALQQKERAVTNAVKKQQLAQEAKQLAERLHQQQLASEQAQLQQQKMNDGIIDRYRARILSAIQQQWIIPKETKPGMESKFLVQLSPSGQVEQVTLIQSSGSPVLDRSARVALFKASPLPVPQDPGLNTAFRSIRLAVKPGIY